MITTNYQVLLLESAKHSHKTDSLTVRDKVSVHRAAANNLTFKSRAARDSALLYCVHFR